MKLFCDRKSAEYHPATGLLIVPGEHDYPDEKAAQLIALGLKKVKDPVEARKQAADLRKRAAEIDGERVDG